MRAFIFAPKIRNRVPSNAMHTLARVWRVALRVCQPVPHNSRQFETACQLTDPSPRCVRMCGTPFSVCATLVRWPYSHALLWRGFSALPRTKADPCRTIVTCLQLPKKATTTRLHRSQSSVANAQHGAQVSVGVQRPTTHKTMRAARPIVQLFLCVPH